MEKIRSLICLLTGHVDHGKSQILESIADIKILKKEAGKITQTISAISAPFSLIQKICGPLLSHIKTKINIPGYIFIDSPGHAAFTNLRKRGGNLADIAILVIDINEGLKPQTLEAIEILRNYKTPFIIALNKIDLISGYKKIKDNLVENLNAQPETIQKSIDDKLYNLVGKLSELGLISERFDRIDDYTKQIAIIPISAKSKQGLPELLMVLTGLAQRFLETKLKFDPEAQGKGTILEIKEEKGTGITLNTILYDGHIKKNDTILIGGLNKPVQTKIKVLSEEVLNKFKQVNEVKAAAVIKISAPDLEEAFAGMPLRVANKDENKLKKDIQKEIDEVLIETEKEGIVIKADSLGSLEALITLLREKGAKIKRASIGDISKKDIAAAASENNPFYKIILGFNVKQLEKADIKIINHNVIYKVIEEYEQWEQKEKASAEEKKISKLVRPFKFQVLSGYVFRQSNPCVVGVEVLGGKVRTGVPLIKENGTILSELKTIQLDGKNIQEAKKGEQVAAAIPKVIFGRQLHDQEIIYSALTESQFRELKKLKDKLSQEEKDILKEIATIYRKENQMWGI